MSGSNRMTANLPYRKEADSMYCIKCGVELANGAKRCPLCGTPVIIPEELREEAAAAAPDPSLYPENRVQEKVNHWTILVVLTILSLLPSLLCMLIDLRLNNHIVWSGYVSCSLLLVYTIVILPFWFQKRKPYPFILADGIAIGILLAYICIKNGGHWFFTLALPIILILLIMIEIAFWTLRGNRMDPLLLVGLFFVAGGIFNVLLETMICITFHVRFTFWSFYPLIALGLIGAGLIFIAMRPALRKTLYKKFFV